MVVFCKETVPVKEWATSVAWLLILAPPEEEDDCAVTRDDLDWSALLAWSPLSALGREVLLLSLLAKVTLALVFSGGIKLGDPGMIFCFGRFLCLCFLNEGFVDWCSECFGSACDFASSFDLARLLCFLACFLLAPGSDPVLLSGGVATSLPSHSPQVEEVVESDSISSVLSPFSQPPFLFSLGIFKLSSLVCDDAISVLCVLERCDFLSVTLCCDLILDDLFSVATGRADLFSLSLVGRTHTFLTLLLLLDKLAVVARQRSSKTDERDR